MKVWGLRKICTKDYIVTHRWHLFDASLLIRSPLDDALTGVERQRLTDVGTGAYEVAMKLTN